MPITIYDWEALRIDYLANDYPSLKAFALKHNIKTDALYKNAKTWPGERTAIRKGKTLDGNKDLARRIGAVDDMNRKQLKIANTLMQRGYEYFRTHKLKQSKHAIDCIVVGTKMERDVNMPKGREAAITIRLLAPIPRPGGKAVDVIDIGNAAVEAAEQDSTAQDTAPIDTPALDAAPIAEPVEGDAYPPNGHLGSQ